MKKIIFTVTNDLNYDQRMQRICNSLAHAGYTILLIGRELDNSVALTEKIFKQNSCPVKDFMKMPRINTGVFCDNDIAGRRR